MFEIHPFFENNLPENSQKQGDFYDVGLLLIYKSFARGKGSKIDAEMR